YPLRPRDPAPRQRSAPVTTVCRRTESGHANCPESTSWASGRPLSESARLAQFAQMKSLERTACLSPSGAKSLSKHWENQSRKRGQDTNLSSTSGDLRKAPRSRRTSQSTARKIPASQNYPCRYLSPRPTNHFAPLVKGDVLET